MDFPFPFKPYPSQVALMNEIYSTIDGSKVGLMESPTGTGKSLSIICSALLWLRQEEEKAIARLRTETSSSGSSSGSKAEEEEDDWFEQLLAAPPSEDQKVKKGLLDGYEQMVRRLEMVRRVDWKKERVAHYRGLGTMAVGYESMVKKIAGSGAPVGSGKDQEGEWGEDEYAIADYDSDANSSKSKSRGRRGGRGGRGAEDGLGDSDVDSNSDGDDDDEDDGSRGRGLVGEDDEATAGLLPKIYYCSRTHSQISQFVNEIKSSIYKDLRCCSVASRKVLCVNDRVRTLGNESLISETCLEMQKKKKKQQQQQQLLGKDGQPPAKKPKDGSAKAKSGPCEFHSKSRELSVADIALAQIMDVEDLVDMGQRQKTCPYYSSRRAIRDAQLVCLPYNFILQADLRSALGINLKGSVVIFDEAHNLIDTINQLHSAEISFGQLKNLELALTSYLRRFETRLAGKNMYYLNLLSSFVKKLGNSLVLRANHQQTNEVLGVNSFLFSHTFDNYNFFKMKKFIQTTKLIYKLGNYYDAQMAAEAQPDSAGTGRAQFYQSCVVSMRAILSLIECLSHSESDGRVFIQRKPATELEALSPELKVSVHEGNAFIKFVLFNPSAYIKPITEAARSVLLVGGTLKPFQFIIKSLFDDVPTSRMASISCGHIVPTDHVLAYIVTQGKKGCPFEFTFDKRHNPEMLTELYEALFATASQIKKGVVVFFTSYKYMEFVLKFWKTTPCPSGAGTMLASLESKKPIYVEVRNAGNDDRLLTQYSRQATTGARGAMLFSVMGGKLSEGINFSDDLARCVAVVGLPYGDNRDAVLKEKMKFVLSENQYSPQQYMNDMCMRTVNQSIGRSIRHFRDYASILLFDKRYAREPIMNLLPSWIAPSLSISSQGEFISGLGGFQERIDRATAAAATAAAAATKI